VAFKELKKYSVLGCLSVHHLLKGVCKKILKDNILSGGGNGVILNIFQLF
jgi:hypothetical protein